MLRNALVKLCLARFGIVKVRRGVVLLWKCNEEESVGSAVLGVVSNVRVT